MRCIFRSMAKGNGKRAFAGKIIALPLLLGIISLFTLALYYYSANHAPYKYVDSILIGPVLSCIGIVISFCTRKQREKHPILWMSGVITCLLGFIGCVLILAVLVVFAFAMLEQVTTFG